LCKVFCLFVRSFIHSSCQVLIVSLVLGPLPLILSIAPHKFQRHARLSLPIKKRDTHTFYACCIIYGDKFLYLSGAVCCCKLYIATIAIVQQVDVNQVAKSTEDFLKNVYR
jgi:hypothetical protein